jgi:parallel beta-helix repeat protein
MFAQKRLSLLRYLATVVLPFSLANTGFNLFAQSTGISGKTITVPDEYPTIQKAIDATEKGAVINIKPGDYEETIILKSGISIKGIDINSVIIYCDARNGPVLKVENCNKLEISGLTLKHTGLENMPADFKGKFPVLLVNSSNIIISRCKIQNSASDGVLITDTNAVISECLISDNNNYGLAAYGASTLSLSDNIFCGNGANGLFLKGIRSAEVCRNSCSNNGHYGISVAENSNANLIQNNCTNNKYSGIIFGIGATGSIKDNTCRSNAYQGIIATGEGTNVSIQGNISCDNGKNGIYFEGKAAGSIVGNKCSENLWHGISIADGCSTPSIIGNNCFKNKHCGLYVEYPYHAINKNNESQDNGDVSWVEICELRNTDKFEQLESIASRLRNEKCRYNNGNWQLEHFYSALGEGWGDMNYFPQIKSTFEDWIKKYPNSVTPRIALAIAYRNIAWQERGGGYAYKVTEKGREGYKENLKKAERLLIEAEDLNVSDPQLYAIWVNVGMGQSKTDEEMDALFERGVAIEKYYWPLYHYRAWSITPRWGGQPGQLENFARHAVELTSDREGQILYLKVASVLIGIADSEPQQFKELGFSYKQLLQACDDLVRLYPDTNNSDLTNVKCFLACAYEDKDTAKHLFAEIGSDWRKNVWTKKDIFNKYKDWALGKIEKVPPPQKKNKSLSDSTSFIGKIRSAL